MKLKEQVCRRLAKRLKELGVKQESCFWWQEAEPYLQNGEEVMRPLSKPLLHCIDYSNRWSLTGFQTYCISAFTVAELGEMLPTEIKEHGILEITKGMYWNSGTIEHSTKQWQVRYTEPFGTAIDKWFNADTEADARAKMLIYLLENGLLNTEKQERLKPESDRTQAKL